MSGVVSTEFKALTRHGRQARAVLATARAYDRGTPLMPLGLVLDKYVGYNAGVGPSAGCLNKDQPRGLPCVRVWVAPRACVCVLCACGCRRQIAALRTF